MERHTTSKSDNTSSSSCSTGTNGNRMMSSPKPISSPATQQQRNRLKYWVSTVAAVIDPTLPSPSSSLLAAAVPDVTTSNDTCNTETVTTAASASSSTAAPTNSDTTTTTTPMTSSNHRSNHGTYIPPQIPPFLGQKQQQQAEEAKETVTTTDVNRINADSSDAETQQIDVVDPVTITNSRSNELDHQQKAPTITSREEVLIFDNNNNNSNENDVKSNTEDNHHDNQKQNQQESRETGTANIATATSASSTSISTRFQSWKKQASDAMMNATTTATTSQNGTANTAIAMATKAKSVLLSSSTSWKSTFVSTTTSTTATATPATNSTTTEAINDREEEKKIDENVEMNDQKSNHDDTNNSNNIANAVVPTIPSTINEMGNDNDEQLPIPKETTTAEVTPTTMIPSPDTTVSAPEVDAVIEMREVTATDESIPTIDTPEEIPNSDNNDVTATKTTTSASTLRFTTAWNSISLAAAVTTGKKSLIVSDTIQKTSSAASQVFRGRYATTTTTTTNTSSSTTTSVRTPPRTSVSTSLTEESQSTRIGKLSNTADHWNNLTSQLQPHEYILLLGRGMLGVNLKQCYKLHSGVYVDFLVPNGSAYKSQVVQIGDIVVRIGNTTDCLKYGTIATVPSLIANASRPVHITLATSGCFSRTDSNSTDPNNSSTGTLPNPSMNYIDIAVALLHSACTKVNASSFSTNDDDEDNTTTIGGDGSTTISQNYNYNTNTNRHECPLSPVTRESNFSTTPGKSSDGDSVGTNEDNMTLIQPTSFDMMVKNSSTLNDDFIIEASGGTRIVDWITSQFSIDALLHPIQPSGTICKSYMSHAAKRNIESKYITYDYTTTIYHCSTNVRCAIQNAFILCITDPRRLPFVKRFAQLCYEEELEQHQQQRTEEVTSMPPLLQDMTKHYVVMISLFMDLYQYIDLYDIIPTTKQRTMVQNIAYKYFLPTIVHCEGNIFSGDNDDANDNNSNIDLQPQQRQMFQPPQFDFHTLVSDTSLRKFEALLKQQPGTVPTRYPRNIFVDFQESLFRMLTESIFVPFIISDDCARMRAYLRNTAPYMNIPISSVIDTLTTTSETSNRIHANNYFMYCLVYLLCMMEQEEFGENDDLLYDVPATTVPDQSTGGTTTTTAVTVGRGARIQNAASSICAAMYIRKNVLPAISNLQQKGKSAGEGCADNMAFQYIKNMILQLEHLWEVYVAPGVGSLVEGPKQTTAVQSLQAVRSIFVDIQTRTKDCTSYDTTLVELLSDPALFDHLQNLADELIYDYALRLHPKFRLHKYHEWVCDEILQEKLRQDKIEKNENGTDDLSSLRSITPAISSGCVKRLLRKAKFPVGITPHQASHDRISDSKNKEANHTGPTVKNNFNAECAIVFGTKLDLENTDEDTANDDSPLLSTNNISRYVCMSMNDSNDATMESCNILTPDSIPATLESYAYVPLSRPKAFRSIHDGMITSDGWEISLINFMLPHMDTTSQSDEKTSIYGVSLMFQYRNEDPYIVDRIPVELASRQEPNQAESTVSPTSTLDDVDEEDVTKETHDIDWFHRVQKQQKHNFSTNDDVSNNSAIAVGLALVSQKNHILAMRETLTLLMNDFIKSSNDTPNTLALINRLGDFASYPKNNNPSTDSLRGLLEPYIQRASVKWIDRPIHSQANEYLQTAGHQLIQCLPPIPLALLLITVLLEQKIVLTSNRRSVLLSVTTAVEELIQPLQWCHLILARVPSSLAYDLLQYPAPYILGLSSSDPDITELLRELPSDVTLVDLDVGRVILAPSFGHDTELVRRSGNSKPESTTTTETPSDIKDRNVRILRSQVLYLAQCLGNLIGTQLYPTTWCSDQPDSSSKIMTMTPFDTLRTVCRNFVSELLAGIPSCCYWIEEATPTTATITNESVSSASSSKDSVVATILFDEDHFFAIKNARYRYGYVSLFPSALLQHDDEQQRNNANNEHPQVPILTTTTISTSKVATVSALSMNDFDCIIELLLRCQCINVYIGSTLGNGTNKNKMAYF